ncbi:MAG: DUF1848 domain-containing protein [Candidatus Magnetoovum sp. WYHC-5]|nr:DUF1848 domain-containing protein [Candidatus Magnetoovum sp. WYHC-5]
MIISASRRTDIPAFYAEWFMECLHQGYVDVQNPFNPAHISRVSLLPDAVDVIVFWTKNPRPIIKHLKELDRLGVKYYFLFTLNGYSKAIEPYVPALEQAIATFRELSMLIGIDRVIWRFDPILITDVTDEKYIVKHFYKLAGFLQGYTRRIIFSFAEINRYKKVLNKMNKQNIKFYDITNDIEIVQRIALGIADIAQKHSIAAYNCAQPYDFSAYGVMPSKCIDDKLIKEIFGISLNALKDKSQRPHCGCVLSKDIGRYKTCKHGCVYCYAA